MENILPGSQGVLADLERLQNLMRFEWTWNCRKWKRPKVVETTSKILL